MLQSTLRIMVIFVLSASMALAKDEKSENTNELKKVIRETLAAQANVDRDQLRREFLREPAEDFELTALDGKNFRLSSLHGKITLVNFWASWCLPCVAEMPILIRLYEKYHEAGLEILAISVDEDPLAVRRFASTHQLPFPVLVDTGVKPLYDALYNLRGLPAHVFVDDAGDIRYKDVGLVAGAETVLETIIQELLAEGDRKEDGRKLFINHCGLCHRLPGDNVDHPQPEALATLQTYGYSDVELVERMRTRAEENFIDLSPEEITQLLEYIRSLEPQEEKN